MDFLDAKSGNTPLLLNLRARQNTSKTLITEVSPSRSEGEPVSPSTTTATAATSWELEDKQMYYIKKLGSMARVKAERPRATGNDVAHLLVASSRIPQAMWKRLLVREVVRVPFNFVFRPAPSIKCHPWA